MIAIDTETTGVDFHHGARPFFVTICEDDGTQRWWEWDVDPLTRASEVPMEDVDEIKAELIDVDVVGQNIKFDVTALRTLSPWFGKWPWGRTDDTLLAGHLLASNQPHDLTSMVIQYLGRSIQSCEDALEVAVKEARKLVRANEFVEEYGEWATARHDRPDMPSCPKSKTGRADRGQDRDVAWKYDAWLPRAVAMRLNYEDDHPWRTVLRDYANTDSAATLALWRVMRRELEKRGLWKLYQERRKLLPVVHDMEWRGVTLSRPRLEDLSGKLRDESDEAAAVCRNVARGYSHRVTCPRLGLKTHNHKPCPRCEGSGEVDFELELPAGGANGSLREFCINVMGLEVFHTAKQKTNLPSLGKDAIRHYLNTLEPRSRELTFVKALEAKRVRDTGLSYLTAYEKFWIPLTGGCCDTSHSGGVSDIVGRAQYQVRAGILPGFGGRRPPGQVVDIDGGSPTGGFVSGWYVLHPSLNPTGTDTLRFSSSNPNSHNIKKGEDGESLRYTFGPPPGYEWWSLDAQNIELRLPAYKSGEADQVALFQEPDAPPFYGSVHLLNFSVVYPDVWEKAVREVGAEKAGPYCKKTYAATYYQWCKNGDFAIQYGAGSATADRTFRRTGSYARLKSKFARLEALNQECIRFANRYGYVETWPDRTVDPEHGYPLLCSRTDRGDVLPTVPFNYKTQGTAMWWTCKGMVRCHEVLGEWNRKTRGHRTVLQIHDEMVFEMPRRADPRTDPKRSNLGRARELAKVMALGGDDIDVPTPVGIEYHPEHWGAGVTFKA